MEPTREQWCQRRIAQLEAEVALWKARAARAEAEVAELKTQVARLVEQVAKLSKNSSNSSKPPSSDIVKPPKAPCIRGRRRKIGGQPGHSKHDLQQRDRDSGVLGNHRVLADRLVDRTQAHIANLRDDLLLFHGFGERRGVA